MSCVSVNCNQNLALDPYKRVCYSQGLVLGVDEFVQEEIYFLEQHRWHNRGLHGYGTVCGLEVQVRDTVSEGPEIFVAPGMALDPQGRRIRVAAAQCARINEWLARFGGELGSPVAVGSPDAVTLFLRLCYRECSTDRVPIPSGPCRTEDEASVPSRVLDDFRLELTTSPPDQTEADTVREFARLLRSIEFTDADPPTLTAERLQDLVRALGSPGSPPTPLPAGSPDEPLRVSPADAEEYLRAAFRVWVTEVRPGLLPDAGNCSGGPPAEGCVLLAQLSFPVAGGPTGLVVDGDAAAVEVSEAERPFLLHTQLIQELFLGGGLAPGQGGVDEHGQLLGLEDDDHPQYLLVDPLSRALIQDLDAAGNRVVDLAEGVDPGDAMPMGQPAGGDLDGVLPAPRVVRIQGRDVADLPPADQDVLTWNNNRWEPRAIPQPPGSPQGPTNFEERLVRIFALSWRHNVAHDFFFLLDGQVARGVAVAFGMEQAGDANVRIGSGSLDEYSFQLFVEDATSLLLQRLRVQPRQIVPIDPVVAAGATHFVAGQTLPGPFAPAVLLTFDPGILGQLRSAHVYVELHGDQVMDEGLAGDPRAIDAEFVRGELPTGDRPAASRLGLQGGRFTSWFRHSLERGGPPFDFREVTFDELVANNVPRNAAEGIISLRAERGGEIRGLDDLRDARGVGDATLGVLRRVIDLPR
jgi:hypothetical protein